MRPLLPMLLLCSGCFPYTTRLAAPIGSYNEKVCNAAFDPVPDCLHKIAFALECDAEAGTELPTTKVRACVRRKWKERSR